MARRATKDTIAFEPVGVIPGDDTVVRREVKAGGVVPDHWDVEDSGAVEEDESGGGMTAGLGAAPHAYPHQIDEDTGRVKDEHIEDVDTEATRPAARGRRGPRGKAKGQEADKERGKSASAPGHGESSNS